MDSSSHVYCLNDSEDYGIAESDSTDHLSELPDSLILSILSLLPMKEVGRTSILSKRWRGLWTTVPCFRFDRADCFYCEYRICKALSLWRGSRVLKFSLRISIGADDHYLTSDVVDFVIRFAIEHQVEELYLNLTNSTVKYYYALWRLCSCSSIQKLTLVSCQLNDCMKLKVQWDQLVSLTVEDAEVLNEKVFNQILSGAPQLEILNMSELVFNEDLYINSSSLKVVEMQRCHIVKDSPMLRIDAPNLETLKISGVRYKRCLLNVPSLTNIDLCFQYEADTNVETLLKEVFLSMRHVEKVTLSDNFTQALFEMKQTGMMILPFSNVKFVELFSRQTDEILDVLELFPQLTTLVIACKRFGSRMNHPSNISKIRTPFLPHLRKVEIAWIMPESYLILLVLEVMLRNAHVLEKMVFRPIWIKDLEYMVEVEEAVLCMPRSSPTAEVIVINENLYR